jgi:hypothetical protein
MSLRRERGRRNIAVTGLGGWDVSLTRYAEGWRATFIRRDYQTRAWVGQAEGRWPRLDDACSRGNRPDTGSATGGAATAAPKCADTGP